MPGSVHILQHQAAEKSAAHSSLDPRRCASGGEGCNATTSSDTHCVVDLYLAYMSEEQQDYNGFYASPYHAEPEDSEQECGADGYHAECATSGFSHSADGILRTG